MYFDRCVYLRVYIYVLMRIYIYICINVYMSIRQSSSNGLSTRVSDSAKYNK